MINKTLWFELIVAIMLIVGGTWFWLEGIANTGLLLVGCILLSISIILRAVGLPNLQSAIRFTPVDTIKRFPAGQE
jgi:hypothetical protein